MAEKIRQAVLTGAAVCFGSVVMGKFFVFPIIATKSGAEFFSYVLGALVAIFLIVCYYWISTMQENLFRIRILRQGYPEFIKDFVSTGITPIDFAFLTDYFLHETFTPLFSAGKRQLINDSVTWECSLSQFQSTFHRYPIDIDTHSWRKILYAEIAAENKTDIESVSAEMIVDSVSSNVLTYCMNGRNCF